MKLISFFVFLFNMLPVLGLAVQAGVYTPQTQPLQSDGFERYDASDDAWLLSDSISDDSISQIQVKLNELNGHMGSKCSDNTSIVFALLTGKGSWETGNPTEACHAAKQLLGEWAIQVGNFRWSNKEFPGNMMAKGDVFVLEPGEGQMGYDLTDSYSNEAPTIQKVIVVKDKSGLVYFVVANESGEVALWNREDVVDYVESPGWIGFILWVSGPVYSYLKDNQWVKE